MANIKERLNLIRLKEPNVSIGIFESPIKFFCSYVKCLDDFHQQDSVTLQISSAAFVSADFADLMLATTVLPKIMTANMKTKSFIRKKASWLG